MGETFELLQEATSQASSNKKSDDHEPRERTGGPYKSQDWSLAAKIFNSNGMELVIGLFKPLNRPRPDDVYLILLQKVIWMILV